MSAAEGRELADLPGIKRRDVQPCVCCKKGVAHTNGITFYRVTVERCVLDGRAIQRESGLENFFGGGRDGAALASIMGDNPDLAKVLPSRPALLCDDCALTQSFAVLAEAISDAAGERA